MILTTELLDVHLGRPVQLVNVHGELNGPLYAFGTETLQFEAGGQTFRRAEWAVFTEPLPAPLSIRPGSVISGGGHVAIRGENGQWRADDTIGGVSDEGIRKYFPEFVVMRPESEVAAEVFSTLRAEFAWLFDDDALGTRKDRFEELAARWAAR